MGLESELKLCIDEADRHRISRIGVVRKYAQGRAVRRHLESIYYDTPDLALPDHGLVLRVRRENGRWIQAVKTGGEAHGGFHRRQEYESPVASAEPNLEILPRIEDLDYFRRGDLQANLQAVFKTDFWRTRWDLVFPNGSVIELALDMGEVRHGDDAVPIHEVELELKRGLPDILYEVAREIGRSVNVQLEDNTKAERGYRLVKPRAGTSAHAARVDLKRADSLEDAFSAILWNALAQVRSNQRLLLKSDDIETVHQMRIGLRRFRSCVDLFRKSIPRAARKGLKIDIGLLSAPLGPARDWDVFLDEHVRPMTEACPPEHPVHRLAEAAREQRAHCHDHLLQTIGTREYNYAILNVAAWIACRAWRQCMAPGETAALDAPIGRTVRKYLNRGHRRIARRGRHIDELPMAELHRLRIDVKRQRYTAEFFASLYSRKAVKPYRRALCDLQDILGELHDTATAPRLIGELQDVAEDRTLQGFTSGWYARGHSQQRTDLPAAWTAFRRQDRFWK